MKKNTKKIDSEEKTVCGCEKKTDDNDAAVKQRIAKKAAVLCASLPDELTCKNLSDQKAAKFLSAMRDFAAECTLAGNWGRDEAASYGRTLELVEAAFDLNSFAEATAAGCGDAKRTCVLRCDIDDGGYFCYFDCRLEYMACLVGTLLGNAKTEK